MTVFKNSGFSIKGCNSEGIFPVEMIKSVGSIPRNFANFFRTFSLEGGERFPARTLDRKEASNPTSLATFLNDVLWLLIFELTRFVKEVIQ